MQSYLRAEQNTFPLGTSVFQPQQMRNFTQHLRVLLVLLCHTAICNSKTLRQHFVPEAISLANPLTYIPSVWGHEAQSKAVVCVGFLHAFPKLRKATSASSCMCVTLLSTHGTPRLPLDGFHEILYENSKI